MMCSVISHKHGLMRYDITESVSAASCWLLYMLLGNAKHSFCRSFDVIFGKWVESLQMRLPYTASIQTIVSSSLL